MIFLYVVVLVCTLLMTYMAVHYAERDKRRLASIARGRARERQLQKLLLRREKEIEELRGENRRDTA